MQLDSFREVCLFRFRRSGRANSETSKVLSEGADRCSASAGCFGSCVAHSGWPGDGLWVRRGGRVPAKVVGRHVFLDASEQDTRMEAPDERNAGWDDTTQNANRRGAYSSCARPKDLINDHGWLADPPSPATMSQSTRHCQTQAKQRAVTLEQCDDTMRDAAVRLMGGRARAASGAEEVLMRCQSKPESRRSKMTHRVS